MASTVTPPEGVILRPATRDDIPAILRLLDMAIVWLVSQGRPGQWGTEPRSKNPDTLRQADEMADSGGCWVAVDEKAAAAAADTAASAGEGEEAPLTIIDGVIGAMAVGPPKPYSPPATEPEKYITLMLVDRNQIGRGIGKLLLDKARALAREAGVTLMRVDCYRGDDGKLVQQYEKHGFTKLEEVDVPTGKPESPIWPGQILIQRLDAEDAKAA